MLRILRKVVLISNRKLTENPVYLCHQTQERASNGDRDGHQSQVSCFDYTWNIYFLSRKSMSNKIDSCRLNFWIMLFHVNFHFMISIVLGLWISENGLVVTLLMSHNAYILGFINYFQQKNLLKSSFVSFFISARETNWWSQSFDSLLPRRA